MAAKAPLLNLVLTRPGLASLALRLVSMSVGQTSDKLTSSGR